MSENVVQSNDEITKRQVKELPEKETKSLTQSPRWCRHEVFYVYCLLYFSIRHSCVFVFSS